MQQHYSKFLKSPAKSIYNNNSAPYNLACSLFLTHTQMRNKFALLAAITILTLALVGCNQAKVTPETANNTPAPGTEPGTVEEPAVNNTTQDSQAVVFNLTGKNFAFSQTEIRVKEGDTVTIKFSSTEGYHDWMLDEFDAKTERVQAGDSAEVTFVAGKAGTYEYYCSVGNHRAQGMVGKLIVE